MSEHDPSRYESDYSEGALFDKLSGYARAAGRELVEKALLLYLVMRDAGTPTWAKTAIVGALGYFIAPIDAIPDLIPGVGYGDDLGVLVLALGAVASSITPAMRRAAARTADRIFGASADLDSDDIGPIVESEATVVSSEPA